jgi:hypothetical protein
MLPDLLMENANILIGPKIDKIEYKNQPHTHKNEDSPSGGNAHSRQLDWLLCDLKS